MGARVHRAGSCFRPVTHVATSVNPQRRGGDMATDAPSILTYFAHRDARLIAIERHPCKTLPLTPATRSASRVLVKFVLASPRIRRK